MQRNGVQVGRCLASVSVCLSLQTANRRGARTPRRSGVSCCNAAERSRRNGECLPFPRTLVPPRGVTHGLRPEPGAWWVSGHHAGTLRMSPACSADVYAPPSYDAPGGSGYSDCRVDALRVLRVGLTAQADRRARSERWARLHVDPEKGPAHPFMNEPQKPSVSTIGCKASTPLANPSWPSPRGCTTAMHRLYTGSTAGMQRRYNGCTRLGISTYSAFSGPIV